MTDDKNFSIDTQKSDQELEQSSEGHLSDDFNVEITFSRLYRQQILDSVETFRKYDNQYKQRGLGDPIAWQTLGIVENFESQNGNLHLFRCMSGWMSVARTSAGIWRIRVSLERDDVVDSQFSYALADAVSNTDTLITHSDGQYIIDVDDELLVVSVADGMTEISVIQSGKVITRLFDFSIGNSGQCSFRSFVLSDSSVHGLGCRAFNTDLRGREYQLWNADPAGYSRGDDPINYSTPFYLVNGVAYYGVLCDNSSRGAVSIDYANEDDEVSDTDSKTQTSVRMSFEAGNLDIFVFSGDSIDGILAEYTGLTGRTPMPALWNIGFHQSRYSYMTQDEVLEVARQFRERAIPCDTIYLDIHYMDEYRIFTWNEEAFPDMRGMVAELHGMGFTVVPILDPGVKIDEDYKGYQTGVEQDVFIKLPDGEPVSGVVWPGLTHLPDFGAPHVRKWWAEQIDPLLDTGVDGIWNDMNEPLFFGDQEIIYAPDYAQQSIEDETKTHLELHNTYGLTMGLASRQALEARQPDKRAFSIIRAGYAGAQRYTSSWTGDNVSTWDQLRLSISMVLNMNMTGHVFTGPDIGGFGGDTTGELLARWTQAGIFFPFYRNHSAVDTIHQEPWCFTPQVEAVCKAAIELRYRFIPYLYTCFAKAHYHGHAIIKPIFTAEPRNRALRSLDDSYLVGDDVLVAPVLHPETLRRQVYLPQGEWIDYHSNQPYQGGTSYLIDAPLDRIPLFVRAGSVIPLWDVKQSLSQLSPTTLTLRIYPGNLSSSLYEDDGNSMQYLNGACRWRYFSTSQSQSGLTVTQDFAGEYDPGYASQNVELALPYPTDQGDLTVDGAQAQTTVSEDKLMTADLDDGTMFRRIEYRR